MPTLTTIFRPVGHKELQLIAALDFRRFPPRLPHQPIFYPVLTEDYAIEIARDWNTKDIASDYAGYVLAFEVAPEDPTQVPTADTHRRQQEPAAIRSSGYRQRICRP